MPLLEEVAIYGFPLMALVIFSAVPFVYAIPTAMIAGLLLLPPAYELDLSGLPPIDRSTMIGIATAVLAAAFAPGRSYPGRAGQAGGAAGAEPLAGLLPRPWWARLFLVLLVVGPVLTVATNLEPVRFSAATRPALVPWDVLNMIAHHVLLFLPLLVARKYLGSEAGNRAVLFTIAAAGLLYTLPTVAEIRFSPQLHNLVYGYFPHSWLQHRRGDGFRPLVFMPHALVLSLFLSMALLAVLAYMRALEGERRALYFAAALYLAVVLVFSKSLGALLVAALLGPVILLFGVRAQLLAAAAIALFVLSYPGLRTLGASPFQAVVAVLEPVAPTRASSLAFRLNQENEMVAHVAQKPLFGWGGFGRSVPTGENDDYKGVRDGLWLIQFGHAGWVGYLGYMGLLAVPVILLAARAPRYRLTVTTSGLAVVLAANLVDLIPNSGVTVATMLAAGALLGRLERAGQESGEAPAGTQISGQRLSPAVARSRAAPRRSTDAPAPAADAAPPAAGAPPLAGTRYTRFPVRRRMPGKG